MTRQKRPIRKGKKAYDRKGPPFSPRAAADFVLEGGARGITNEFLPILSFSPEEEGQDERSPVRRKKPPNNRARGWNGTFSFAFFWVGASPQEQQEILRTLEEAYGCMVVPPEGPEAWKASVHTTGKRVKSLTRMLNRAYGRCELVWKEDLPGTPPEQVLDPPYLLPIF